MNPLRRARELYAVNDLYGSGYTDPVTPLTLVELTHVARMRALGKQGAVISDLIHVGSGFIPIGVNRSLSSGARGELESLQGAVTEFDGPHNGFRAPQGLYHCAQRHHVGVVPALYRLLWADFYAAVTFPALLRLLVIRLHCMAGFRAIFVEPHQIVRTDILTSGFILAFTAVTFISAHIRWHTSSPVIIVT